MSYFCRGMREFVVSKRYQLSASIICASVLCLSSIVQGADTISDPFLPDTVIVGNSSAYATGAVVVPINFVNDEALGGIEITLTWNSLEITLDSVSFLGSRIDYTGLKGADISSNTVVIHSIPLGQPDIPIGSGLFGRMFFSYPIDISSQTVLIDSLTIINGPIVHSVFFSDSFAGQFVPQFRMGSIIFNDPSCCLGIRGNFDNSADDNIDIIDLTDLVGYIFKGGDAPVCWFEGNIDGDEAEQIGISDLTFIVAYIFKGGPAPPACP